MKKIIGIVSIFWIVTVSASFVWNYFNLKRDQETTAFQTAKSFFSQIQITREWNADHGGVYVPIDKDTQPNPYLDDPLKNIEINNNLTLTKINPSFMTRQLAEITARREGIRFRITSLKPIRPENRPTQREENVLKAFEKGVKEIGYFVKDDPNIAFFYMAPLKTEKSCLLCHAKQGYKVGDIRGGISVMLPFVPEIPIISLIVGHIVFALLGILIIFFFGTKLNQAYEVIKRQAVIDSLTGIPNRRSFSERIHEEFSRCERDNYPLSVIMCDIDNFKSYNDLYGHKSGDECLKKVAHAILKSLKRPSDFCARYGGEEFIVVLPRTKPKGARIVAEKIHENILKLNIKHEKSLPAGVISMSLGVATYEIDNGLMSQEDLVVSADKALYQAKNKGRNRVEIFNE